MSHMGIKSTDISTWTDEDVDIFMRAISPEPIGKIGIGMFSLIVKQFHLPMDMYLWTEEQYETIKHYFCKTERSEYGMKNNNQICCIKLHDKVISIDSLKHAKQFLERSGVNSEISEETLSGLLTILLDINASEIMNYLDQSN